ncbi:MAG: class I SAM-dependent methyltransferase, partial [Fibromonadaceae bacterium]|nr:class I SAM-dependent methyltransferase [Fibromonadaceae bacterium]
FTGNYGHLQIALLKAFNKRKNLRATNAYRLCNGIADGLNGLVIDKYANHYQIQFFTSEFSEFETEIVEFLKEVFKPEFIAVKYRFINYKQIKKAFGDNSKTIVCENNIKFAVDLLDTLNPGLFLDMRDARLFFAKNCTGKDVLNLFAYTCSFALYARKHKAAKAVNVDISKKNLNKGKENYLLNEIEPNKGEFFCGSAEEYIDWAIKKEKKFGAIAIDPPSFAKNSKETFSIAKDFGNLAVKAVKILENNGIILLATNYSKWSYETLLETAKSAFAANGKSFNLLQKGTQGLDFPGSGESKESCMNWVVGW